MPAQILSRSEIIAAVKDGAIKIAYYSVLAKDGAYRKISEKTFVNLKSSRLSEEEKLVRDYFELTLESDSVGLKIGPYAKIRKSQPWAEIPNTFERSGDTILDVATSRILRLRSFEHVIIGTNEYIEIDPTIGAAISANVRNTDIGISHISTIIDPGWSGILQIGIFNQTSEAKNLKFLDPLCIVRFHKHKERVDKEVLKRFRENRPHYGNSWWLLERETGRQFFPRRQEYAIPRHWISAVRRERIVSSVYSWAKFFGPVVLISAAFAGAIYLQELGKKIDGVISNYSKFEESLRRIELGSEEVNLQQNQNQKITVRYERPAQTEPFLTYELVGASRTDFRIEVAHNQTTINQKPVYIGFTLSIEPSPNASHHFRINWAIIHNAFWVR